MDTSETEPLTEKKFVGKFVYKRQILSKINNLESMITTLQLQKYRQILEKQHLSLEALLTKSSDEIKNIDGLPFGPAIKIVRFCEQFKEMEKMKQKRSSSISFSQNMEKKEIGTKLSKEEQEIIKRKAIENPEELLFGSRKESKKLSPTVEKIGRRRGATVVNVVPSFNPSKASDGIGRSLFKKLHDFDSPSDFKKQLLQTSPNIQKIETTPPESEELPPKFFRTNSDPNLLVDQTTDEKKNFFDLFGIKADGKGEGEAGKEDPKKEQKQEETFAETKEEGKQEEMRMLVSEDTGKLMLVSGIFEDILDWLTIYVNIGTSIF